MQGRANLLLVHSLKQVSSSKGDNPGCIHHTVAADQHLSSYDIFYISKKNILKNKYE